MEKSNWIILLFLLLLVSCNKIGVKDKPIPVEQIFGTYDLWNGEKITLNADFTYVHCFVDSDSIKSDIGIWYYQYYKSSKINEILTYDMRAWSKKGKEYCKYYSEYLTHQLYACKVWGKIKLTPGYAGDPDGAPLLKWYDKIQ